MLVDIANDVQTGSWRRPAPARGAWGPTVPPLQGRPCASASSAPIHRQENGSSPAVLRIAFLTDRIRRRRAASAIEVLA